MNVSAIPIIISPVMEYMLPGFYTSIQILVLLCVGYFARKSGLVDQGFQKSVSSFLIKAALPVYFFTKMGKSDLSVLKHSFYMPLAAVANVAVALLFAYTVFSLLPVANREKRAGMALAAFGNGGYIPVSLIGIFPLTIPVISSLFDCDKAVVLIGMYLVIYSPLLWTIGYFLISRQNQKFAFKNLFSPPLYGIIAGFLIPLFKIQPVLFDPRLPFLYIYTALEQLGLVLAPMILVTLGAMIAGIKLHDSVKKQMSFVLAAVIAVRYFLLPGFYFLAYFFVLKPLGIEQAVIFVLFLEFFIPPANNFSTMAMESGVNEDLTAFVLFVTYILYIILLPVMLMFFMSAVT